MKKIIFSAAVLTGVVALAQNTGIGTTNPQEKLDVAGNIRVQSGAKIYAPGRLHITGDETLYLLNKQGVRISTAWQGNGNLVVEGATQLLGVNAGTNTDQVLLRSTDGTVTQMTTAALFSANGVNFYNSDGTLTSSRSVNMAGKSVTWNGGEQVYTNTNAFRLVSNKNGMIFRNDGADFYMLPSTDQNGLGQWTENRPFIYDFTTKNLSFNTQAIDGNVGIGTTNPTQKLDVNGAFMQVQGVGFNGQKQLAYLGADGANNDIQVGSLNPNVTDVSFYNAGNATYMNGFMNNLSLNNNLAVGGTTALQNVPTGSNTDNVLVRGNDNIVKQISASTISSASEPWFNKNTQTAATSNTQDIYQMGAVGIGTNSPTSKLTVFGDILSTNAANDGTSYISTDGSLELYRNPASTSIVSPTTMGYIDYKYDKSHDADVRIGVERLSNKNTYFIQNVPTGQFTSNTGVNSPFFINLTDKFIGINNNTPNAVLHVIADNNISAQFASNTDESVLRMMPSNSLDNRFAIGTNGTRQDTYFNGFAGGVMTNLMTMKHASGNVGIGEANPATKLAVNGEISYGNYYSNTLTRANAGLQGDAGARSGFYEYSAAQTSGSNYPAGASGWWHLLDTRHSNDTNNYAMQLASGFGQQGLYYRETANNPAQPWSKVLIQNQSTGALAIQNNLPVANGGNLLTVDAAGNVTQTPANTFVGAAQNIYNTDGTLTAQRMINQNGKSINFNNGDFVAGKTILADGGSMEINQYGSGDRTTYLDIHAADNVDYSARIIRGSGANGNFELANAGSGNITLTAPTVNTTGKLGVGTAYPAAQFQILNTTLGRNPFFVTVDGSDGGSMDDLYIESYAPSSNPYITFSMMASRGTKAAPQNLQFNDPIYNLQGLAMVNGAGKVLTNFNMVYKGDGTNSLSQTDIINSGGFAMRIDTNNNVGIGTGTPTQKLEVAGKIKADQFIAGTSTFPDYVFQNYYTGTASKLNPSYKFTSLNETEKYIKENGHLPGFESAEEITKKGEFSVSETSLKSVEKIEELYLHMIELEKRVQQLEKENNDLKSKK